MLKYKFAHAFIVLLAAAGLSRAAAPQLPDKAVGADTIMMVHMDGSTLTPEALRQAVQNVLGANNAATANQQIAKYQEKYDKAMKAGVQSVTFVASDQNATKPAASQPDDTPSNGIGYVQLKPGADATAVQKMISDEMDPEKRPNWVFSHEGNFVVMHEKTEKLPATPDRSRAAQFSDAIDQSPSAGMLIVFVPNQASRDQYDKSDKTKLPPFFQQIALEVLKSKWSTVAINVGNKPGLVATANAADEASATQMADGVNAGVAYVKQEAQKARNGQNAQNGLIMMVLPMVAPLADTLKPTQAGNRVTVTLEGQPLQTIAQMGMGFLNMMGGLGGAGPGPGAGRGGRSPAGAPARGQ